MLWQPLYFDCFNHCCCDYCDYSYAVLETGFLDFEGRASGKGSPNKRSWHCSVRPQRFLSLAGGVTGDIPLSEEEE